MDVVVRVEEGAQRSVDVLECRPGRQVVCAPLSEGPPEALHLAAGLRVMRLGVDEANIEPRAGQREGLAAVTGPIVEI